MQGLRYVYIAKEFVFLPLSRFMLGFRNWDAYGTSVIK